MSSIKRDQSIIFTTVPEEETEHILEDKIAKVKSPDRPKFLNLKNKTTDHKYEIKTDRPSLGTPYRVCSTPITDLNKVLHQNILSICVNSDDPTVQENLRNSARKLNTTENNNVITESGRFADKNKSASMVEFREKLKAYKNKIVRRYNQLSNSNLELNNLPKEIAYQTISDPLYPFFKANGFGVSNSLHEEFLNGPLNFLDLDLDFSLTGNVNFNISQETLTKNLKLPQEFELKAIKNTNGTNAAAPPPSQIKERRKSLTLPLKSLSMDQSSDFVTPVSQRPGVLLTPLMSKLSSLTLDEKSSGFCSKDTTPCDYKDFNQANFTCFKSPAENNNKPTEGRREAVLFVCGQQDMVMCLLLENDVSEFSDVISQLVSNLKIWTPHFITDFFFKWDMCTESLGKLEKNLRHCMETYSGGGSQSETSEPYSYLCLDPQWDTIQRGGPWSSTDLGALTHLHRDFINTSNLTEILLRYVVFFSTLEEIAKAVYIRRDGICAD